MLLSNLFFLICCISTTHKKKALVFWTRACETCGDF